MESDHVSFQRIADRSRIIASLLAADMTKTESIALLVELLAILGEVLDPLDPASHRFARVAVTHIVREYMHNTPLMRQTSHRILEQLELLAPDETEWEASAFRDQYEMEYHLYRNRQ